MTRYAIEGSLKLTSPLHITDPSSSKVDLSGKEVGTGFPCSRTRLQFFAGTEKTQPAPLIPANTLRGKLRRACAAQIHRALTERNEHLSVRAYSVLQCGSSSGNPDGIAATMSECIEARKNPYFGLFGGGPRLLRSFLRVSPSYAHTESSSEFMPFIKSEPMKGRLTDIVFMRKVDDVLTFSSPDQQKGVIADYFNAVNDWQDSTSETNMNRKASKEAVKEGKEKPAKSTEDASDNEKSLTSFVAKEFVIPGTRFGFQLELNGSDAQLGLLFMGINEMAEEQRIGGSGQIGSGRFIFENLVLRDLETNETIELLPKDRLQTDIPTISGSDVMSYFDAANEWLSTVASAEFEGYAGSLKPKKAKKGSKEEVVNEAA